MLDALGGLWVAGVEPDWRAIDGAGATTVDAPTYPFQRQPYWIDAAPRRNRPIGEHPLLGSTTDVPALATTIHEVELGVDAPFWLDDHRLAGAAVFPGAAFAEMALAAAGTDGDAVVESLAIGVPLVLPATGDVTLQTIVSGPVGRRDVQIMSLAQGGTGSPGWTVHATATAGRRTGPAVASLDVSVAASSFDVEVDVDEYYAHLYAAGLMYGPTFRGVTRLLRRHGAALGHVRLPGEATDAKRYRLHPALLDACFHVLGAAIAPLETTSDEMFVPVSIEGLHVGQPGAASVWCVATVLDEAATDAGPIAARLDLFDEAGAPVASVARIQVRRDPRAAWERLTGVDPVLDTLYDLAWRAQRRAERAGDHGGDAQVEDADGIGGWIVVADDAPAAEPLRSLLAGAGGVDVEVMAPFDADHLDDVIDDLVRTGRGRPVGVVSLCGLDVPIDGVDTMAATERAVRHPLALAHVVAARAGADVRLWLVTRGAQSIDGEPPAVAGATVWGLGHVIANEQPQLACTCIDIDPAGGVEAFDGLVAELLACGVATAPDEAQVALRGPQRFVARLRATTAGLPHRPSRRTGWCWPSAAPWTRCPTRRPSDARRTPARSRSPCGRPASTSGTCSTCSTCTPAIRGCGAGSTTEPIAQAPEVPLTIYGQYVDSELPVLLAAERPDVLLFAAQVPETYAYTLSVALQSGVPIVASALGAFPERLAGVPRSMTVPWDAPPAAWNDAILAIFASAAPAAMQPAKSRMPVTQ